MPNAALNNVTTADGYTVANSLDTSAFADHINIDVANAAVFWQIKQINRLGENAHMATWQTEVFMTPGSRSIRRPGVTGVRVRSGAAGVPAQVTIELAQ